MLARFSIVCSLLIQLSLQQAFAQPVAGFSMNNAACLNESIDLTNTSVLFTKNTWDFCHHDLSSDPAISQVLSLPATGGFFYNSIRIVSDNGIWLGFVSDMNGTRLFRLNFGSDLETIPAVVNLGNPGSTLTSPGPIDMVKENGIWYIFILNIFQNKVTRLTMGDGLTQPPTAAEDMGNLGATLSTPIGIKIVQTGSINLLFVANLSNNTVSVIDFDNSFASSPIGSSSFSNILLVEPCGIDVISVGSEWRAVISSFKSDGKAVVVNFGTDLSSAPTFTELGPVPNGREMKLAKEGLEYVVFVRSETNGIYRGKFTSDFSVSQGLTRLSTNLLQNQSRSLELVRDSPYWRGFTVEAGTGKLIRMNFSGNCETEVTTSSSVAINPENLKFLSPGDFYVELTAKDEDDLTSVAGQMITISSDIAPEGNIEINAAQCLGVSNQFHVASASTLTSYDWDFGDSNTASGLDVTHTYTSAGTYQTKVKIKDLNNCGNVFTRTLKIYNGPTASFQLPSGLLCTNNEFTFVNTTPDNFDGNLSYQWTVDNVPASADRDLEHSFFSTGIKTVKLVTTIPGCSSEITQMTSSIAAGPAVDFSFSGICEETVSQFTAMISEPVTGYTWDFNDGNFSSDENPAHTYSDPGVYNVTLTVTNNTGCNNSKSETATIYAKPVPDFNVSPPPSSCSGSITPFTDLTPALINSNIISWNWNFDDPGPQNSSSQQNPDHTFADAGVYDVLLSVTTDAGCSGSLQKQIPILPSPVVTIDNSVACKGLPVNFTSTGNAVQSYYWEIGTSYYEVANPIHIFNTPGNYEIYLLATGSNNCQRPVTKTINIPEPLVPDFSVLNNCIGYDAVFTDVTTGNDPVASRQWTIVGVDAGTTPAIAFPFTSTGNKEIRLRVTSAAGCSYTSIKNINVAPAPKAAFTATPDKGAAPLTVSFINASTGTATYTWIFSESSGATSNQISPTYTFQELGEHNVELIARSNEGCEVRANKLITIEAPLPDVELKIITVSENADGSLKVIITIQNRGNTILENLPVHIDISGEVSLREIIEERILPSAMHNLVLSYGITQADLKFLCATAELENDLAPKGNRMCTELGESTFIFTAYPNPVKSQLNIEWINHKDRVVSIFLSDAFGRSIIKTEVVSTEGLNRQTFDVNALQTGIYFLVINDGFIRKTQRILVSSKN